MRGVLLEPARLRIAREGYDVEDAAPAALLFDSDVGPAGSIAMSGTTRITPSQFELGFDSAVWKEYLCSIPLNRAFPSPPGAVVGMLVDGENRVNMSELRGSSPSSYFRYSTTTTHLLLHIRITTNYIGVIINPASEYYFSWIVFN